MSSVGFTIDTLNILMEMVDNNKNSMNEHEYIKCCNLLAKTLAKTLSKSLSTRQAL